MKRQDKFLLAGLVIFSLLTSFMFVFYGLNIFLAKDAPRWLTIFAYVTAGYGLGNLYILSWAWRGGGKWAVEGNRLIALCYLGVFIMDTVNKGIENGTGVVGILMVAVVVGLNWFAVKKVVEGKK